MSFFYRW